MALENPPHIKHRLGLFFLHLQIPNLKHQIDNLILTHRGWKSIILTI